MKSKETAKLLGIRKSHLRFYCSKKLISPTTDEKGQYNYSDEDIRKLRLILEYRKAGISIEMIRQIFCGTLPLGEALRKTRKSLQLQLAETAEALRLCEELLRKEDGSLSNP